MEFKKLKRNAELFLSDEWCFWRLASVDEVKSNMDTIKQGKILESWDIARLLDGWVDGPGYRYTVKNEYKPNIGHMLLVKTTVSRQFDGIFEEEMFSGVKLNSEGRKAALLLSCDDKITEVTCFVLESIIEIFRDQGKRQSELDSLSESLKETFSHNRTVLHYAADQPHNGNQAKYVAELVLRNFEYGKELIKAADKYGRTALHFAALHGHIQLCNFLMTECGLKADEKDRKGENILHLVVNSNKSDKVASLVRMEEVRCLVASQDAKGKTPLHKAAANGNTHIISRLLHLVEENSEEYVRRADLFGQTALHEAASGGHKEAVKYLLEKGSRPLLERNSEGKTALHYCVQIPDQQRAKEMAEIVLNHHKSGEESLLLLWASATGMGTAEQSAESSSTVHCFLKGKRNNETKAESSKDLLLSAVKLGYDALAWELINRGANTSQLHNYSKGDLSQAHQQRVQKFLTRAVVRAREEAPDQPTIHDSLGRRAFAEGIAALFLNPYVKSPVTVGISGQWGIGKSSLMLQTEMIMLQAAAQQVFPNILPIEDFPGQFKLTQKDRSKYNKVKNGVKDLLPASEIDNIGDDPLVYFLDNYQDKYRQVYQSLALVERGEMFGLHTRIPNILTVRYNAWHYRNELEAWAGLAVTITKAMEATMTTSQRIRSRWQYAKKEGGSVILLQFLLPCILSLCLSGLAIWVVWMLLRRSKHGDLEGVKYGSIAITLVVMFWTVTRQLLSVFKPVTVQVMKYIRLPDHSTNLGYQHQVISDLEFLKEQICEKPSRFWKFLAGNWLWSDTVEGTSIPKSHPPSKSDLRIVVFVDDLDRCEDAIILKVLSAVNLVLAVCEINVIIGMDKKMILRAIDGKYRQKIALNRLEAEDLAEKYLRKIVQLTLDVPELGYDERIEFLNQQMGEEFKKTDDDAAGSSETSLASQSRDTEMIPQKGLESLPDAQRRDAKNPRGKLPESFPEPLSDGEPSDVENPHENLPQIGPENRSIVYQIIKSFRALGRRIYGWDHSGPATRSSKLKSTIVNSRQLIMRSYSDEERKAIAFLSTQTTDDQLPREWKRFLLYHRLAWNIFLITEQAKNISLWQVQLLVWTFCCWQWKDNVNRIRKNWKKLVSIKDGTVYEEEPSFKTIVEDFLQTNLQEDGNDSWKSLIQILHKYDVTMESVESFEKFRLHCDI